MSRGHTGSVRPPAVQGRSSAHDEGVRPSLSHAGPTARPEETRGHVTSEPSFQSPRSAARPSQGLHTREGSGRAPGPCDAQTPAAQNPRFGADTEGTRAACWEFSASEATCSWPS